MAQKPSREYMRVGRTIGILAVVLLVFGVYSVRLFQVQIVDGEKYASAANAGTKTDIEISAARGEILDTYNRPMVINRTTYEVVFDYNYFPRSGEDRRIKQAAIILSLCASLSQRRMASLTSSAPLSAKRTKPRPPAASNVSRAAFLSETAVIHAM